MEQHKNQFRGVFIPATVFRLFEAGKINGDELLLLTKIDALQDSKRGGCYASNRFLSEWWGKTTTWTSKTISKLAEIGLIRIRQKNGSRILISLLFTIELHFKGVEQNFKGGLNKTSRPTKTKEREDTVSPDGDDRTLLPVNPVPDLSPAVIEYARFSQGRDFHVISRNGKIQYAKGGGAGGWTRPTLNFWEKKYQELLSMVPEDRIRKALRWFFTHYDDEFTPGPCRTFPRFVEKFDRIERQMRIDQRKFRRNSESEYEYVMSDEERKEIEEGEKETARMVAEMKRAEKKNRNKTK